MSNLNGFIKDIELETKDNVDYRRVLFTTPRSQLVLMSIEPGDDIGLEVHDDHDQFIRIEQGMGRIVLNENEIEVRDGFAIVVPAGTKHNLINTSQGEPLKIYTIYTPPEHQEGVIHKTKEDAAADTSDQYEGS